MQLYLLHYRSCHKNIKTSLIHFLKIKNLVDIPDFILNY